MADEPQTASDPAADAVAVESPNEDAETKATREELKHTVISDKADPQTEEGQAALEPSPTQDGEEADRKKTPDTDSHMIETKGDALKEQVSSPKKKRAHDEVEDNREADADSAAEDKANGTAVVSRTDRAEPEKKRPRDKQGDEAMKSSKDAPEPATGSKHTGDVEKEGSEGAEAAVPSSFKPGKPATSTTAFTSSGFAKLSSSSSPFGALGGGSKPSVFGASSGSLSPFGALAGTVPVKTQPPTLSFGGGNKPGSASPFASLNGPSTTSTAFGSVFGGVSFGSGFGGPRLTSFAKPGEVLSTTKEAKPFGAPDSDAEEGGDSDSSEGTESGAENDGGEDEDKEKEPEESSVPPADDKKKLKLQRVAVDDGEAGEVTILQLRTRLYYLEKDVGWKERGAGMLKVNVPERCVEYDEEGLVIAASFDASTLDGPEDDEESTGQPKSKVVRLIMRQDSTHRVILNTALLKTTVFQERATLKSTTVLFTAFEGAEAKAVNIQLKMSAVNAKTFMTTMAGIQKELRGD